MRCEIPVHVQSHTMPGGKPPVFVARTLFCGPFEERHEQLERALTTLTATVRKHLRACGRDLRHDKLCDALYSPWLDGRRVELRIDLRKQSARGKLLVVVLRALGRQVAFTPQLPDLWFEVSHSASLAVRAQDVLSEHFQRLERETGVEQLPAIQQLFQSRSDWITTLDFQLETSQVPKPAKPTRFALMGEAAVPDGDEELERVGRSLLDLYPDDLDRAVLREDLSAELDRLLNSQDRRPILLLGPRGVGKTTLVHEFAFQRAVAQGRQHRLDHGIWLLSPQRLIAGMSYVGQWEARLLAILKTAEKRRHLLYFDDLLGLFQAGKSAQSNLCVADVLKPYMERREVSVLAETTPESWRVLRERDRSLSDLFRVLPVNEPTEAESLRILLAVMAQLEGRHRCRIGIDVLPTVMDLQRRYVRDAVMPGKVVAFLRRMAVKYVRQEITRDTALREFQAQSGLSMSFLDSRSDLKRRDVMRGLQQQVIGQTQALSAVTDVTMLAKARLNDPGRPLAALLFLGPTGVGKTQTAKSLAAYLYGDADRLIRFDMNEFVSVNAVSRLVGTFDQPDGLLTGTVRRQPFAVVLFDEIEKAHPSVMDLLLQVLGEGRLTDAVGRSTDFTNTIIILTSNLGVRRSEIGLGFDPPRVDDSHTYIAAAESFFRPEFFNRLDRVVPFSRLEKTDVRRIADLLLRDMLTREGLRRRRCALSIEPLAVDRMVDLAFDPVLGARAMRRGLERQVARDVAQQLVHGLPEAPTIIRVYPAPSGVQVRLIPILNAEPWDEGATSVPRGDITAHLPAIRQFVEELAAKCDALRPTEGFQAGQITAAQHHYLSLRERIDHAKRLLQQVSLGRKQPRRSGAPSVPAVDRGIRVGKWPPSYRLGCIPKRNMAAKLSAVQDLHIYFQEQLEHAEKSLESPEHPAEQYLLCETGVLRWLAESEPGRESQQSILLLEGVGDVTGAATEIIAVAIQRAFSDWGPVETTLIHDKSLPPNQRAICFDGPCSDRFAELEAGTHLVCPPGLGFIAIRARHIQLPTGSSLRDRLQKELSERDDWLGRLATGIATLESDPAGWLPAVRIYDSSGFVFDVRSNTLTPDVVSGVFGLIDFSNEKLVMQPMRNERHSKMWHEASLVVETIRQSIQTALQIATQKWLTSRYHS